MDKLWEVKRSDTPENEEREAAFSTQYSGRSRKSLVAVTKLVNDYLSMASMVPFNFSELQQLLSEFQLTA